MQLGSYVLLSTLSHKCPLTLSPQATKAILNVIIDSAPLVTTAQFVKASVAFCSAQQQQRDSFGEGLVNKVLGLDGIEEEIQKALSWKDSENFLLPFLSGCITL